MIIIKIYLRPLGVMAKERLMAQGTVTLRGIDSESKVRTHEVKLYKQPEYGGPADGDDLARVPESKVWRRALIKGHKVGGRGRLARGAW
ncbi:MAG: hypothetical protein KC492_07060, partial [Myxococcales bacterium]|nr:hypothetical protein [Myxococcales bacterium]